MTERSRVKLQTRIDADVLAAFTDLARIEGAQISGLVEEALTDLGFVLNWLDGRGER